MAILRGEQGAVQFNDTVVVGTRSWTLNFTKDTLDSTRHGHTFRNFGGSVKSGSGTIELIYRSDTADQAAFVEDVVRLGDPADATFELFTSNTTERLESLRFTGIVTSMDITSAMGDVVVATCDFITSGEITSMVVVKNLITQGGDQLITQSGDSLTGKVPVFL